MFTGLILKLPRIFTDYKWLSQREHQVEHLEIDLTTFHGTMYDCEVKTYSSFKISISKRRRSYCQFIASCQRLHSLIIRGRDDYCRQGLFLAYRYFIQYVLENCQQVMHLTLSSLMVDDMLMAVSCCPKLTDVKIHDIAIQENSFKTWPKPTIHCEHIVSLSVNEALESSREVIHPDILGLISACTNLESLYCEGNWILRAAQAIFPCCIMLEELSILLNDASQNYPSLFADLVYHIATHCHHLKKFDFIFCDNPRLDMRTESIHSSLRTIISRLNSFIYANRGSSESDKGFISSIFDNLRSNLTELDIATEYDDADMIGVMLRQCDEVQSLEVNGRTDICPVVIKVSESCHLILDLRINYEGILDGLAMKTLLVSCPLLKEIDLSTFYHVDAYESLALYGNNLTEIRLDYPLRYYKDHIGAELTIVRSFDHNSSKLFMQSPTKRRKRMETMTIQIFDLDVASLSFFLSFFGKIRKLSVVMVPKMVGESIDIHSSIPQYSAEDVITQTPQYGRCDRVFFTLMGACRGMRSLDIYSCSHASRSQIDGTTLAMFIYKCIIVEGEKLRLLRYCRSMNLSTLILTVPQLKLVAD
jgi:hypothetical protein